MNERRHVPNEERDSQFCGYSPPMTPPGPNHIQSTCAPPLTWITCPHSLPLKREVEKKTKN